MAEQKQDRKAEIQAIKEKRKLIKDTIKDQKSLTGEMVKQVQTAEGLDKILDDVFGTREKAMQLEHEMQKALKSGKKEAIEKVHQENNTKTNINEGEMTEMFIVHL